MNVFDKYKEYVNISCVKEVEPLAIEKAQGAIIYDKNGKEYIDCFAGISVVNTGHCNSEVLQAAKRQMDKFVHCCSYVYYSNPTADLAEKLAKITPGRLKKSFFSNSGAEANEGAMRISKQFTKRSEFIALESSFHGRTIGTLSVTGTAGRKKGGGPYLPGIAFAPAPYCYRCFAGLKYPDCDLRCARILERVIISQTSKDVAAFIVEPILGEGGIIVPPDGYFKVIKEILDHYSILFITDEVQTGFARTGKMFAIEHYNIEPDIMTMAKGIANGFPLSVFIARKEIADSFSPGDHLSTFGGNPISCAAALANIEFIERQDLCKQSRLKGEIVMSRLKKLAESYGIIGQVRGKGLMIGVELVRDKNKTPANREASEIRRFCLEHGVLIGCGGSYGNVLRFQPPLVISKKQLLKALEVIGKAIGIFSQRRGS
jgi:4-aminobutyrate aminotransferase